MVGASVLIDLNTIEDMLLHHPLLKTNIRGASFGDAPAPISQGEGQVNANPTPPRPNELEEEKEKKPAPQPVQRDPFDLDLQFLSSYNRSNGRLYD